MSRKDLYENFYMAHLRAFPLISKDENQKNTYTSWNKAKKEYKNAKEFDAFIAAEINKLNLIAPKNSQKSLISFFNKIPKASASSSLPAAINQSPTSSTLSADFNQPSSSSTAVDEKTDAQEFTDKQDNPNINRKYATPSQNDSRTKIAALESQINSLILIRDSNLGGTDVQKKIQKAKIELEINQTKLKRKIQNSENQKNFRRREKKKKILSKQAKLPTEMRENINVENSLQVGRPRIEDDEPDLLKTICDIAIFNSAADERRQTAEIRTCTTLKDLTKKLNDHGFKISKSAVYLRLLPRRCNTLEGMRHVKTVPVRLCKPQNDFHKNHTDGKFCAATIGNIETLASFLGPNQVAYISQDDKARVKIGITAANKQSTKLMHVEYRVKLPDHDWVIASKHTLIPSVYAGIQIIENSSGLPENVTYSGPTYVAIRSGKHSSSTAATHANDIHSLYELESFKEILYDQDNQCKPILIISVDGGPDENPRYHKTIMYAIDHFKKFELDAIFIMTNAPGRSAFNKVERRMAPLSRALTGVILPYNFYGNHLNSKKETKDEELEIKNFSKAGEVLEEIWSQITVDNFPVSAKYVAPDEVLPPINEINWAWHKEHVRESQYCLQIVKCNNRQCCADFRSDINLILKDRFLPPPLLMKREQNGRISLADPVKDAKGSFFPSLFQLSSMHIPCEDSNFCILPYDYHCFSMQDSLVDRVCSYCDIYFASMKNLANHRKVVHPIIKNKKTNKKVKAELIERRNDEALCIINYGESRDVEWIDNEQLNAMDLLIPTTDNNLDEENDSVKDSLLPVIDSIEEWLTCDWTEDVD